MTARFKRLIARFLIGAVLFAQFAVAAYACPQISSGEQPAQGTQKAPSAMQSMPGCDQMAQDLDSGLDAGNPALCLEHCHQGQQTASHAQVPSVPPLALVGFVVLPHLPGHSASTGITAADEPIVPAASPPLSILHCCFRI